MRRALGSLAALAAVCLLTITLDDVAHAQISLISDACNDDDAGCDRGRDEPEGRDRQESGYFCEGVDAGCLFSLKPVPGVRIVRFRHYPRRPAHYVSGDRYTTLATARETSNRFAVVDFFVPPGGGPFPHTHIHEWEIFFVVQGTANFYMDVDPNPPFNLAEQAIGPGTAVYAPKCRVMGFTNRSGAPARILNLALPAGIDNLFHLVGDEVVHYNAPIPPPTPEQLMRLAFWGEREFQDIYFPGGPPPACPGVPERVVSSITDPTRPLEVGPFGETRVVLVTPTEVGDLTGATAFCGFGPPGRPGGTVKYSHFSLPNQHGFPPPYISENTELFYGLGGTLDFLLGDDQQKRVRVGPMDFVEIQAGVPFSIANLRRGPAEALAISVIAPLCQ